MNPNSPPNQAAQEAAPAAKDKLVTVAERSDEISATILVSILEDAGIKAVATGGFTAGFRAEAPGLVQVKTFARDAEEAIRVISEVKRMPE